MNRLIALFMLLFGLIHPSPVPAEDSPRLAGDLFEMHVRPMLVSHCIRCHGEKKQKNGLRLDSRAGFQKGGKSGPVIVAGKPDESLLVKALRHESPEMPPTGRLEKEKIFAIMKWIEAGAPWPQGVVLRPVPAGSKNEEKWWCFQPIGGRVVPEVDDEGWCRNEIDRFIFARLAKEGIRPASQSEPLKLARRVHFALTGLPPDETTISAAVAHAGGSPASSYDSEYERLVDKLLQTQQYGENQARYWLDLVRYAESDGYKSDGARPDAHLYRDYVIACFNDDTPYDRFVTQQLAGDETDPGNRDALIATMLLRHGIYEWNQRDVETQWKEILNDITETTADVFLALGMKCARCHDHKFDPITQRDYYGLQAFFAPLLMREDQPVAVLATRTAYFQKMRQWSEATEEVRRRLHEIENPVLLKHSTKEGFKKFVGEIKEMIIKRPDEREPYEHQVASLAERQFEVHPDKLGKWLDKETQAERLQLLKQLEGFVSMKPAPLPTLKFVVSDVGPVAPPTFILGQRGKTPIAPGFPQILEKKPAVISSPPEALQSTGRRTALAKWITDPGNPLTARVIVNRIWQQYFGRGLVETSSDFGRLGKPPSHPELLDWLARRLIEDGWSLKSLHRRILTSATYRQSSQRRIDGRLRKIDPENILLWRMNSRRLSGEEFTDSVLSASGELKKKRRAIYKPVLRNKPDRLLALFDRPERIRSSDQRHRTTTSSQALLLFNGQWVHDRAAATAKRFAAGGDGSFIRSVYLELYGRPPAEEEAAMAKKFLLPVAPVAASGKEATADSIGSKISGVKVRAAMIRALLNSNGMIYVD